MKRMKLCMENYENIKKEYKINLNKIIKNIKIQFPKKSKLKIFCIRHLDYNFYL